MKTHTHTPHPVPQSLPKEIDLLESFLLMWLLFPFVINKNSLVVCVYVCILYEVSSIFLRKQEQCVDSVGDKWGLVAQPPDDGYCVFHLGSMNCVEFCTFPFPSYFPLNLEKTFVLILVICIFTPVTQPICHAKQLPTQVSYSDRSCSCSFPFLFSAL